jgi:hypothetical protein
MCDSNPNHPADKPRHVIKPLSMLVQREARRVLSEAQLEPDPERVAAGWERRFITDATRSVEMLELYRELGYEVCADPVRPEELLDDCQGCAVVAESQFVTIYTRDKRQKGE